MQNIIIFGPPGVGKGTQSKLIAEKLNLAHFSTGDILRSAVSSKTVLGLKAKEIMEKGDLVPDEIMIGIVKEALSGVKTGFILDGFPRTVKQAEALENIFKELNLKNVTILCLTADDSELIERLLKRGRTDDNEETIKVRLNVYREATKPVLDFYRRKYDPVELNGVGEIEQINENILEVL